MKNLLLGNTISGIEQVAPGVNAHGDLLARRKLPRSVAYHSQMYTHC